MAIAERFKFLGRRQQANETVLEFVAQLRKMAEHCRFGAMLGESLRDLFVRGLHSETTQKKLLSEADLTLARALKIAQALEAAEKRSMQMRSVSETEARKADVQVITARKYASGGNKGKPQASYVKEQQKGA